MQYKGYQIILEISVNYWCDIDEEGNIDYIDDGGVDLSNTDTVAVLDPDGDFEESFTVNDRSEIDEAINQAKAYIDEQVEKDFIDKI